MLFKKTVGPSEFSSREFYTQYAKQMLEEIESTKDEILRAFIAKYGCSPDDAIIEMRTSFDSYTWHVREKTDEEKAAINNGTPILGKGTPGPEKILSKEHDK